MGFVSTAAVGSESMAKFRKVNLPAIQYRVAEGRLFLHMKSCFELLDLVEVTINERLSFRQDLGSPGKRIHHCDPFLA